MKTPHILLAGSGRSGTTWIGDVLSSCRGCCSVFEPLNTDCVPEAPKWGRLSSSPGCYLRCDESHSEWRQFFDRIFSGRISNRWTRQDWRLVPRTTNGRPVLSRLHFRLAKTRNLIEHWKANTRVVKTIRGNLLLPWLANQFPLEIVHLIRHPCAVIGSQIRLGWQFQLDDIYAQPVLIEDLLSPYSQWLRSASTPLDKLAVLWCVENLLPTEMASQGLCHSVIYEQCEAHPESTFSRLFADLGLTPARGTRRAITARVSSPSQTQNVAEAWHAPLTLEEGERVLEIVSGFGFDHWKSPQESIRGMR